MSFLAFAGGAAKAYNKAAEEKRAAKTRMETMKFGADYQMYLDSIKNRTNEKAKHNQASAWATSKTQDPPQQKILYQAYLGLDGDTKAVEEYWSTNDFSGVTPESTSDISMDFQPTTELYTSPTLQKWGIDPEKARRDPVGATLTDQDKRFAIENTTLPQGAPITEHYNSAVENVKTKDLVDMTGMDEQEIKSSGMVKPTVAPSQITGRGVKPKGSKFNQIAGQMTGGPQDVQLMQMADPADIPELKTISERKAATNADMAYLKDNTVWESNIADLGDGRKASIEVATTPNGVKYGRMTEGANREPFVLAGSQVLSLGRADSTDLSRDEKLKVGTEIKELRNKKEAFNEAEILNKEYLEILQDTPEANTYVANAARTLNNVIFQVEAGKKILNAVLQSEGEAQSQAMGKLVTLQNQMFDEQSQSMIRQLKGEGKDDNYIRRVLNNSKRVAQLQMQLAFRNLAIEGQTGRDVSVPEFERSLQQYQGNPISVGDSLRRMSESNRKRLSSSYNLVDKRFASTPKLHRVMQNNLGENVDSFLEAGLSPETIEYMRSGKVNTNKKGDRVGAGTDTPNTRVPDTSAPSTETPSTRGAIQVPQGATIGGKPLVEGKVYQKDGVRYQYSNGQLLPMGQ